MNLVAKQFASGLAVFLALHSGASMAGEYEKDGWPCVRELCIGDRLDDLSKIKWEKVALKKQEKKKPSTTVADDVERVFRGSRSAGVNGPSASMAVLVQYFESSGGTFDSGLLKELPKLYTCNQLQLKGVFYTASGLKTEVTILLIPLPDAQSQEWRVVSITRYWQTSMTNDQRSTLISTVEGNYFAYVGDKRRPTPAAANVNSLWLSLRWLDSDYFRPNEGLNSVDRVDLHMNHPSCKPKAPATE